MWGSPWGSRGDPVGTPWGPHGIPMGSPMEPPLGPPWGPNWLPMAHGGLPNLGRVIQVGHIAGSPTQRQQPAAVQWQLVPAACR